MRQNRGGWMRTMRWIGALAAVMANLIAAEAIAITINVKTPSGLPITTGFRYTIEEDRTYDVIPGCTGITPPPPGCPAAGPALSLNFHRSYMPVVAQGCVGSACTEQLPLTTKPNEHNRRYLKTKQEKMGHLLNVLDTDCDN